VHWDWASFAMGIGAGLLGGLVFAGVGLFMFAKGMSDE
jgi:hypothetical protein